MFLKAPSTLSGATDPIGISAHWPGTTDWEVELAFAIGRPAKDVKGANAVNHIAGYMTTNDISCRELTFRKDRPGLGADWLGGKNHDT